MWPFDRKKNQLIQGLGRDNRHTKDLPLLEQSQYQLVFLYDDLMAPHQNHKIIADHSKKVGRGFTKDPFDLRVTKFSGKALAFMGNEGLKLKGELHAVESRHIPVVDNHYKNGVEFARVRIEVLVTDREHQLMSIGSEEFLKGLPPGMIRTVPELGLRHYVSNPRVCVIRASMYVAMRVHWNEADFSLLQRPFPEFPKQPLVWLPKYYKYPIERNRK